MYRIGNLINTVFAVGKRGELQHAGIEVRFYFAAVLN
jgi:hypothetical protein